MSEAAKANKQIEGIICCERLNGTGWPIGLDCWHRRTSSTPSTLKMNYTYDINGNGNGVANLHCVMHRRGSY